MTTNEWNGSPSPSQYAILPNPAELLAMVDIEMQYTFNLWPELQDGKVPTREFLHCCNLVVRFIDSLGYAFTPVSRDVHNNTRTLMTRYVQDRERFMYIEDIIDYDISTDVKTTSEALMWLKRVEDYEAGVKTESLSSILRSSYEDTLCIYHGYILKKLFSVLCAAAPTRSQLFGRLTVIVDEQDPDIFISQLKTFYKGLRINLDALFAFYIERNLYQDS